MYYVHVCTCNRYTCTSVCTCNRYNLDVRVHLTKLDTCIYNYINAERESQTDTKMVANRERKRSDKWNGRIDQSVVVVVVVGRCK